VTGGPGVDAGLRAKARTQDGVRIPIGDRREGFLEAYMKRREGCDLTRLRLCGGKMAQRAIWEWTKRAGREGDVKVKERGELFRTSPGRESRSLTSDRRVRGRLGEDFGGEK